MSPAPIRPPGLALCAAPRGGAWLVAALLALPSLAAAAGPAVDGVAADGLTYSLTGAGQFEYDSNVFDLAKGFSPVGIPGSTRLADSWYAERGAITARYLASDQTLYADLTGGHTSYNYFSELDHSEYKVDAGWKGEFATIWDANAQVARTRAMVPFLELNSSVLTLSTETREDAGFGVRFLPQWRLEGSAYQRTVDWPLPGTPDLKLEEAEGQSAIKYIGSAALTAGLSVAYLAGNITGTRASGFNPSYHQESASLVADYAEPGSKLDVTLGYTERRSPGAASLLNSASGGSGSLSYSNQLTGKTSIGVSLTRAFVAYLTNAGTEIDNTATVSLHWQATFKIGATAGYTFDYGQFPGQGNAPLGSNRLDHVQTASLKIDYAALRWLGIDAYANYLVRDSNLIGGNFDGSVVGIDLSVKLDRSGQAAP